MSEAEAVEQPKEVSIGTLPMKEYKEARSKGVLTVPAKAVNDGKPVHDDGNEEDDAEVSAHEENGAEDSKSADERPKGKGGFQRRIDALIKKQTALEERATTAERRAAELESKQPKTEVKPAGSDEPTREQFQTDEQYIKALARWEVKQEMKAEKEAEVKAVEEARIKSVYKSYNEKLSQSRAEHEDFDEVVGSSDIVVPRDVILAIPEMDNGPEVAYFLGKNPDVCEELMGMSPIKAIGAVWVISESLDGKGKTGKTETESAKTKKIESKAPAPIKPVSTGSTKSSVPLDQMSMSDYKKARAAGRTA